MTTQYTQPLFLNGFQAMNSKMSKCESIRRMYYDVSFVPHLQLGSWPLNSTPGSTEESPLWPIVGKGILVEYFHGVCLKKVMCNYLCLATSITIFFVKWYQQNPPCKCSMIQSLCFFGYYTQCILHLGNQTSFLLDRPHWEDGKFIDKIWRSHWVPEQIFIMQICTSNKKIQRWKVEKIVIDRFSEGAEYVYDECVEKLKRTWPFESDGWMCGFGVHIHIYLQWSKAI